MKLITESAPDGRFLCISGRHTNHPGPASGDCLLELGSTRVGVFTLFMSSFRSELYTQAMLGF